MPNALTERERCRADCPGGGYAYKDRGEVVRCKHGEIFMVTAEYVRWGAGREAFMRLSPFWNRRLYRRAVEALRVDETSSSDG